MKHHPGGSVGFPSGWLSPSVSMSASPPVIERARLAGATGVTILAGKGIGGEARKTFFGLIFEGTQSVLLMVAGARLSAPILKELHQVLVQGTESRGLAFAVPIEHLTVIDMRQWSGSRSICAASACEPVRHFTRRKRVAHGQSRHGLRGRHGFPLQHPAEALSVIEERQVKAWWRSGSTPTTPTAC